MNRAIKLINLIILLFVSNIVFAALDGKGKDDAAKKIETKFAESKLYDYLLPATKIPDVQNLIIDYLKQWVNVKTLTDHTKDVNSVVYSSDNKHLASTSYDKTIKIWDAANYKLLYTNIGHTDIVLSAIYSPDNKHLASGSADKTIKIWDTDTKNQLSSTGIAIPEIKEIITEYAGGYLLDKTLIGHTSYVNSIVYSPDNKHLASGSADNTIKIWDVNNNYNLLHSLIGHIGPVLSVAYSHDNKYLASGAADRVIKIWDVNNKYKLLNTFIGHTNHVNSVVYSPDNKHLASGSADNTIKIWDVNNNYKLLHTLTGHTDWVNSIAYSPDYAKASTGKPDNKYLASVSADRTIRIWDVNNNYKLLHTLNFAIPINSIKFNHNGKYLACGDKKITIWQYTWLNDANDVSSAHDDRAIRIF